MNFRQLKTLTLVFLLLCSVCVAPAMAENQQQKEAIQKDIEEKGWHVNESGVLTHLYREFTFCDDSIGGGYRLPDGARILYAKGYTVVWDKTDKLIANISDENAGPWFSPNPNHASAHNAPQSLEVPSGSYVFHEDNGNTIIAQDSDQKEIISTFSSDNVETFPPQTKSDAEHRSLNDFHQWVAWREIPINQDNPVTYVFAKWDVASTPTPHPKSNENQAFHTFPGINTDNVILQPVLSWNWIYSADSAKREPNSQRNQWSISSHICNGNNIHSPPQVINSPKEVTGEIKYVNGHWEITTMKDQAKSILNDVTKTTYSNPPGPNAHVVFTLEKSPLAYYPGECDQSTKTNNKCPDQLIWEDKHWPGKITFREIKIEPSGSIKQEKARHVLAVDNIPNFKVSSGKTLLIFGSEEVTITTPNNLVEDL